MNVCSCWEECTKGVKYVIKENESYSTSVQICNGTKEREECSCNGDVTKCNFYPEKRKEKMVELNNFGKFNDFMPNRWETRIMTRAEAEAEFNIKIVD